MPIVAEPLRRADVRTMMAFPSPGSLAVLALLMLLSAVAAVAVGASDAPKNVELSAQGRYGLIWGFERELGGKFIVHGLEDAAVTCAATDACTTANALLAQAGGRARSRV